MYPKQKLSQSNNKLKEYDQKKLNNIVLRAVYFNI